MPILDKPISRAEYYAKRYDVAKSKEAERKMQEESTTYQVSQGQIVGGVSKAPELQTAREKAIKSQVESGLVSTKEGVMYSGKPIQVQRQIERPYQATTSVYGSQYDTSIKRDVLGREIRTQFSVPGTKARDTFKGRAKSVYTAEKRLILESPYSPAMYVSRGYKTFKKGVGLGLATTLEYVNVLEGERPYTKSELETIKRYGRGAVDVQASLTSGYVGGYVLGGASASYPRFKKVISSKPVYFGSAILTGVSLGAGYASSKEKGLFIAKSGAGLIGGIGGFKQGYKKFDLINRDVKISRPKLTYSEQETTSRLKYSRLIETDKDFISSKRVGLIDVTKTIKPIDLIFTQKITGGATGIRKTFLYEGGRYGVIEKYEVPKIFGGKRTVVKEFTPIDSSRVKESAFVLEAYTFKGKGEKILPLMEGVVGYPRQSLSVVGRKFETSQRLKPREKIEVYGETAKKMRFVELELEGGRVRVPGTLKALKSLLKGTPEERYLGSVKKTGWEKNLISQYRGTVYSRKKPEGILDLEESFIIKGDIPGTKSTMKSFVRNIRETSGRRDKYSRAESVVKIRKKYGGGSLIFEEGISQRVSLRKPYVREVEKKPVIVARVTGTSIGYAQTVKGTRAIPVFGKKTYIDKLIAQRGEVYEIKYPSQLSETFVKQKIKIRGNPLSESVAKGRYYDYSTYMDIGKPPKFVKMFGSKRGQLSVLEYQQIQQVKPERIEFELKRSSITSSPYSLKDIVMPTRFNIPSRAIYPKIISRERTDAVPRLEYSPILRTESKSLSKLISSPIEGQISEGRTERLSISRTRQRLELRSELNQRQELVTRTKGYYETPSKIKFTRPIFKVPPFRPPIFIPQAGIYMRIKARPKSSVSSFKMSKGFSFKPSKRRLDILPSLGEVFKFEASGREAIKPRKTKKIKRIFEEQYFGKGSFNIPIPVFQKQKF